MLTVESAEQLREPITQWKQQGQTIGFVPTMGNLHAGHLALVDYARQHADKIVVSIFVNPTQFGPNEDFASYPRTLDNDAQALRARTVDLLFTPSVDTMYSNKDDERVIRVPELNYFLCGASRPGHFDGVATVVKKLFELVQPDIAVFGEKDYQQLLVIKAMTVNEHLPVKIMGHETQREHDGLAMSSRNGYLSAQERELAPQIYAGLNQLIEEVKNGVRTIGAASDELGAALSLAGFEVDYVEIRRQSDLKIPERGDKLLVALVAARLGKTRLIDNVTFELE